MKSGSIFFLKTAIVLLGAAVLAICIFLFPPIISSADVGAYRPVLIGMYIPAIPFFIALYQAFKLLSYIGQNKAFSNVSVNVLKNIKYCAIAISILYAIGMPLVITAADNDDAPGVVAVGLVIIFASMVVAVFAALLQKILKDALEIKSENDLTV